LDKKILKPNLTGLDYSDQIYTYLNKNEKDDNGNYILQKVNIPCPNKNIKIDKKGNKSCSSILGSQNVYLPINNTNKIPDNNIETSEYSVAVQEYRTTDLCPAGFSLYSWYNGQDAYTFLNTTNGFGCQDPRLMLKCGWNEVTKTRHTNTIVDKNGKNLCENVSIDEEIPYTDFIPQKSKT